MLLNILILKDFLGEVRAAGRALILACAALWAVLAIAASAAAAPPVVNDLAAALKLAREQRVPVFVAFTLKQCPYCNRARRDYWTPMHNSAEWRAKTLMVEIVLDGDAALRDFTGSESTVREFARRHNIRSVPTVIVFDTQGTPVADALVGLASADFYGAYLERLIDQGLARVRESR